MRIRGGLFTKVSQRSYLGSKAYEQQAAWEFYLKMTTSHSSEVKRHLDEFKTRNHHSLRALIASLRADLQSPSLSSAANKLASIAKLHAAEMALHPSTSAMIIADRGVYAEKAIRVAKRAGRRTILLCEPSEVSWRAASLADHVLPVSDLGDVAACISAINNFVKIMDMPGYGYAVDPGFGKLSENPALPAACLREGYHFSGPAPLPMANMGNKKLAKELSESCGVSVVPGYFGKQQDLSTLITHALQIGFPLMAKKGRSGGGYGNKRVNNLQEFHDAITGFRSADPDEPVFFEQLLTHPMHIEVQVVITADEAVLLGTRNCSLQRDCQKTIEEAPATIPERAEIERLALNIANGMRKLGYTHLGTIEFLVQDGKIYFLEVNPRIQVEHGITEVIHGGLDLIALKHWITGGGSIHSFLCEVLQARGIEGAQLTSAQMIALLRETSSHTFAIEARVEAIEFKMLANGKLQKLPVKGVVSEVSLSDPLTPCGVIPQSAIDTLIVNPLLATVIGKGCTRMEALQDLLRQLNEMRIGGIPTNLPRLRDNVQYLIGHPDLVIDTSTTQMLDQRLVAEPGVECAVEGVYGLSSRDLLFKTRDWYASGESRLPELKYVHRAGRGGSWD